MHIVNGKGDQTQQINTDGSRFCPLIMCPLIIVGCSKGLIKNMKTPRSFASSEFQWIKLLWESTIASVISILVALLQRRAPPRATSGRDGWMFGGLQSRLNVTASAGQMLVPSYLPVRPETFGFSGCKLWTQTAPFAFIARHRRELTGNNCLAEGHLIVHGLIRS